MVKTEYKLLPTEEKDCVNRMVETDQVGIIVCLEGLLFTDEDLAPPKYGYGVRHVQCLIFFLCLTISYIARSHLAVSIVAMSGNSKTNATTYDWSKSTQEMILGSFFIGNSIMIFPFGIVCQKWGGKLPLQIAMASDAILSVVTPWSVTWGGWKALCSFRILQGMSQAGLFSGIHTLLANWVPVSERGSITSYVYTGGGLGIVLAFQFSGILAYSSFGWPLTFWFVGIVCFVGFALITFFASATPKTHKFVSIEERTYIEGGIGKGVATKANTPWRLILTSAPAWATFIAHTGNSMNFAFLYMQVPTYMHNILKFNIRKSGILSSLPHIGLIISSFIFGYLSDYCTNRKILNVKTARKLSNSIASIVPAICVTLVSYTTNTSLAVFYFIVSQVAIAMMSVGWMVNYIDISPNYSGVLMAFGTTITTCLNLVVPVLISNIVTDVTNQSQWRTIMLIIAGITVTTNLVFVIFMSTDVQPWNDIKETNKKTEAEEFALEAEKYGKLLKNYNKK